MTAVLTRPMLKGWSHLVAAVAAAALCPILITLSPQGTRGPAAIYSGCVVALFAISALFHRVQWRRTAFTVMQALDHSMIFVVIAATYTPIAAVALPRPAGPIILAVTWSGALLGTALNLGWRSAPPAVKIAPYLLVGWVALFVVTDLWHAIGVAGFVLLLVGGVLHSMGAVVYASRWPNPWPRVFGFHEIFHLFVIAGVACHYVVIAFFALR